MITYRPHWLIFIRGFLGCKFYECMAKAKKYYEYEFTRYNCGYHTDDKCKKLI
nr:hypothetical protein [Clostridioides difficile]